MLCTLFGLCVLYTEWLYSRLWSESSNYKLCRLGIKICCGLTESPTALSKLLDLQATPGLKVTKFNRLGILSLAQLRPGISNTRLWSLRPFSWEGGGMIYAPWNEFCMIRVLGQLLDWLNWLKGTFTQGIAKPFWPQFFEFLTQSAVFSNLWEKWVLLWYAWITGHKTPSIPPTQNGEKWYFLDWKWLFLMLLPFLDRFCQFWT